jgi:hypothetical protein
MEVERVKRRIVFIFNYICSKGSYFVAFWSDGIIERIFIYSGKALTMFTYVVKDKRVKYEGFFE